MLDGVTKNAPMYVPQKDSNMIQDLSTIELLEEITDSQVVTERILKLSEGKDTSESRRIKHFQFHDWSTDSPVPSTIQGFLGLLRLVAIWQTSQSQGNPERHRVIIHSSDESRSVLFCVLANIMDQLQVERVIDVYYNVKKLRSSHPQMLRSKEQYEFLYECMWHHLKPLPISFDQLLNVNTPSQDITILQLQSNVDTPSQDTTMLQLQTSNV
ncbi:receptor-type tyrosine-protein phosphatase alpha-like [Amphiura filiformis]|uniref:receptor-type tyrosine-protein phosphatase alpha-like n=1 Tax=Amphiura filiformis TaxID=82378 RepID=UPI003B21D0CD